MYFVTHPGDTKYAAVRGGCIHASQAEYYKKFPEDKADQSRLQGFYNYDLYSYWLPDSVLSGTICPY
ncbi:hypothetical protein EMCRGX_G019457 [Ephydatia muelleri]